MDDVKGLQKGRIYDDYAGHPACQGCRVQDFIVCPLVDLAYDKGVHMVRCETLRPIAEKLISAIDRGGNINYGSNRRKRLFITE